MAAETSAIDSTYCPPHLDTQTFYKGWKISETLNQMGFTAFTLGNHEFDGGDELLADFLNNLTFPTVGFFPNRRSMA